MLFRSASSCGGLVIFTTTQITNFHYLFMGIHKKLPFSSSPSFFLSHKFHFMFLVFFSCCAFSPSKALVEFIMKKETLCVERHISPLFDLILIRKKLGRMENFYDICLFRVFLLLYLGSLRNGGFGANITNRKFVTKIPKSRICFSFSLKENAQRIMKSADETEWKLTRVTWLALAAWKKAQSFDIYRENRHIFFQIAFMTTVKIHQNKHQQKHKYWQYVTSALGNFELNHAFFFNNSFSSEKLLLHQILFLLRWISVATFLHALLKINKVKNKEKNEKIECIFVE